MKTYLSKLNPGERRFVVGVGLVFFLVINIFWVWPHFSDWGVIQGRLDAATKTLAVFDEMFQKTNGLAAEVEKMQRAGANVMLEDQAVSFMRNIIAEAGQNGVAIGGTGRLITRTNNPFFLEQIQTINVASGEKPLVDFLYNLGSGDSLVRVRDLSLRPDPQHQQLQATITLIASYQKNAKAPPAAAKSAPAPVVKPVSTAATATTPAAPLKSAPTNGPTNSKPAAKKIP